MFWNHGKEPEARDIDSRLYGIADAYLVLAKGTSSPFEMTEKLVKLAESEIYPQLRLQMLKQIGSSLTEYAESKLKEFEVRNKKRIEANSNQSNIESPLDVSWV